MRASILIVTKDKPEFIRHCLNSLENEIKNDEILIGDTGSTHPEIPLIYAEAQKKFGSKLKLFYFEKYHFSKNNNELARHAKGKFLIFLNNDTVAFPGSIARILDGFQLYPEAGIIGPKLIYGWNDRIQHAGVEFYRKGFQKFFSYHVYRERHLALPEANKIKWTPAVTGACLAIYQDLFWKVEGFDEAYLIEVQDIDLCLKVWKHGMRCLYLPIAQLFHLESGTRKPQKEAFSDQSFFRKRWSSFIEKQFFSKRFQSEALDGYNYVSYVCFKRFSTPENVLSCYKAVQKYKQDYPTHHITFVTNHPEILEGFVEIDRVLNTQSEDEFCYDKVFILEHIASKQKLTLPSYPVTEKEFLNFLANHSGLFLGSTSAIFSSANKNENGVCHYFSNFDFSHIRGLDFLCLDQDNFSLLESRNSKDLLKSLCLKEGGVLFFCLDNEISSVPPNKILHQFHWIIAQKQFRHLFSFSFQNKMIYAFHFSNDIQEIPPGLINKINFMMNKTPKIKRFLKWILIKIFP